MTWQDAIVWLVVAAATWYLAKVSWQTLFRKTSGSGCGGGCGVSCSKPTNQPTVVQIDLSGKP